MLVERGIQVDQFEIAAPTLDEIFIQVVQKDDQELRRTVMNKFWRIAFHEYTRHVFRRRFLFALSSVPLMMVLMVVLIIVIIRIDSNPRLSVILTFRSPGKSHLTTGAEMAGAVRPDESLHR